jgi:hypothetical protein
MKQTEVIATQGRRIKALEDQAKIYQTRMRDVKAELDYICEYVKRLKNNLNKHMSNPKLYPHGNPDRCEH